LIVCHQLPRRRTWRSTRRQTAARPAGGATTEAATEATQAQRKLSKEADEKLVAELKGKGVQIDTVDRKAFVEATKPVYAKWTASPVGDFVKQVVQQAQ
jgi:TRAP-type C4-dicarboxylate transport system substrate-binding protein